MALLPSERFLPGDLAVWERLHRADVVLAKSPTLKLKAQKAIDAIVSFIGKGRCYAGISWGKDSTPLAHLLAMSGVKVPLVYVRTKPTENPDCLTVRDLFLERFGDLVDYHEVSVQCTHGDDGWHWDYPHWRGFREADRLFGSKHISAIRAGESGGRKIRMRNHGLESKNTLAPIGWWRAADVFAYAELHDLPVHPAYAMNYSGTYDREWLRVDSLSGHVGEEHGRHQWERLYYEQELQRLGRWDWQPAAW